MSLVLPHTPRACAIAARKLCKEFDRRPVLQDVSFELPARSYVALLGANGAGKSTLLKLLAGLATPSSGRLELFGSPVRGTGAAARSRLGFIGHSTMLYRDLSALENLLFFGRLYGVRNVKQHAEELLGMVGLPHRAHDVVKTFSRGMLQRLSIARALMHDPELLLADEPFTGLDAPSRDAVERLLAGLHAKGLTVLLVNHDVRQSLEIASRIFVLRGGTLVCDVPASEIDGPALLREVAGP